jgi:hypothetical protein
VDYEPVESSTAALGGYDAAVSAVGAIGKPRQHKLVDAAAAGVERFILPQFRLISSTPAFALPIFKGKAKVREYLERIAANRTLVHFHRDRPLGSTGALTDSSWVSHPIV